VHGARAVESLFSLLNILFHHLAIARNTNNSMGSSPKFRMALSVPLGHGSYLVVSTWSGTGEGDKWSAPQGVFVVQVV
jgi:hypothetical protein